MSEGPGLYSLITTLRDEKVSLKNKFDALVIIMHLIARHEGYICVGTDSVDDNANHVIPPNWNKSADAYTFRYRHPSTGSTIYLLKFLPMETSLLVHGMIQDQKSTFHLEIPAIDEYISNAPLDNLDHLFYNLDSLISLFKTEILSKFQNPSSSSTTATKTPVQTQTPTYPNTHPIDPLREPPRRPPAQYYPPDDEFTPFGVGRNDVFPNIPAGPGGFGGNLIGPHHPGFAPPFGGSGYPQVPRGLPPGARFDPYAPPGIGRPENPDPDNEPPPPGYGNMFL